MTDWAKIAQNDIEQTKSGKPNGARRATRSTGSGIGNPEEKYNRSDKTKHTNMIKHVNHECVNAWIGKTRKQHMTHICIKRKGLRGLSAEELTELREFNENVVRKKNSS